MCARCTVIRPYDDADFLRSDRVASKLADLAARLSAEGCLRASDDPDAWDWRAFLALRQARIRGLG
ncbi:MAG: hypothetical protein KIT11_00385 [Fimbriimonadaceae bacterium]|nr:hypothetical protein [Fimbriimonadaceae bacterium]QYK55170.1 MAG: hypothetical protein KF733_09150 [Fimbriimonadaceae bacterium]